MLPAQKTPDPAAPVFVVTRGGGIVVARANGCAELTHADAGTYTAVLAGLPEGRPGQWVVVDLRGVKFLGSAALTAILRLYANVRAAGGRLTLMGLSSDVRSVFAVAGLDHVLDLREARR